MAPAELPIFALNTVLCPAGRVPLRVFEPRYVDMLKRCMADGTPFGVCLIREGMEVGEAAAVHSTGTLATVVDFDMLEDGLLGVTAVGGERFEILETTVRPDALLVATVAAHTPEPAYEVPLELEHLPRVAKALMRHLGATADEGTERFDDASWVGFRLTELLPLPLADRQTLLELQDPLERLRSLDTSVHLLMEQQQTDE